jgi:NitT/TauT family transport system permease protein
MAQNAATLRVTAHQPAQSPGTAARRRRRLQALGLQLAFVLVVVALWQGVVTAGLAREIFVSKPSAIIVAFVQHLVSIAAYKSLGFTLMETVIGFGLAVVLGGAAGFVLYQAPLLKVAAQPILTGLNNLPRLALSPLFVLWFGVGVQSRVALVVSIVFFIILINTYAGLQSTNRDMLVLARTLGAGQLKTLWTFVIPSAVPTIFAGLQLGLTYALLSAVVGEMLTGGDGLGAQLALDLAAYRTADFFAELLMLAVVATALSSAMQMLEAYLLRWRQYELRGLVSS